MTELTRGAIVLARTHDAVGDLVACLVIQSDLFNDTHGTITVCPLTQVIGGETLFRVTLSPQEHTGLTAESEIQVDKLVSIRRERLDRVIGHASPTRMEQVDQALRRWLML
ncbi:mRNA interferase MazF [Sphingomonas gellani]|uniref:mRNA interferase MazF n=1 Tax=Sphingomonas gellani TaxID=1166340 RepID=A0A1H8ETL1_9SPHN|nr:type II toxin-antitoxin system PemK/MazF family toxin [Sphingomonas gellani]SEN22088.1 mRNA interferase MazF [Sphingomonas gellani]